MFGLHRPGGHVCAGIVHICKSVIAQHQRKCLYIDSVQVKTSWARGTSKGGKS